tara:strand:+ start:4440 stop:5243 length:804 start_codon:yes stop_codon:yes gene_type:complete
MATKIFYSPIYHLPSGFVEQPPNSNTSIWDHPIHSEHAFIPPKRVLEYEEESHKGHSYWECPAWKSYWANSWVVFNQLDYEVEYDKATGCITSSSFRPSRFQDYMMINEGKIRGDGINWSSEQIGLKYTGNLVFQLPQLLYLWLPDKQRNVWVELCAYPGMFHKTGLEFISVEYPFSRWARATNAAFKAHSSKFRIKRGDPLYVMRFRGGKNNAYDLRKYHEAEPPREHKIRLNQHQSLKQWVKGVSWNLIKKDEEKKCPVEFLWKR